MTKQDPSITTIREVRHKISASVGHDPYKLIQHYKKLQERHKHRLVTQTSTFTAND
jgi:hypothetical protein